ncbi:alpha/beta hydrolase fold domain-containing protein [Streptomyces sp. NPDC046939]|uniref:dienelactone hydrolase family protein n=1 Tax=Streptomyces sp. NPDC046939 TaxID=3155376 RepID=UPI0033F2DCD7
MHEITVTRDVPYTGTAEGPRQRLDVYRPATDGPVPVVVLWHGLGPDEKDVMGPLAERIAREGLLVLVPGWRSDAADSGRSHLLASLAHAREHAAALGGDPGRVVLAGWSAGAGAAVGVALHPEAAAGWRPAAVVALAGRYDVPARTTGRPPLDSLTGATAPPVPVRLVHGGADEQVPAERSRELLALLRERRWDAELTVLADTDHAGVIMAAYDPALGTCVPSGSPAATRAGDHVAALCAITVRSSDRLV